MENLNLVLATMLTLLPVLSPLMPDITHWTFWGNTKEKKWALCSPPNILAVWGYKTVCLVDCESQGLFACGILHSELMGQSAQYGTQMFIWRVICCWCCINMSVLVDWTKSDLLSPRISRKLCQMFLCRGTVLALCSSPGLFVWSEACTTRHR